MTGNFKHRGNADISVSSGNLAWKRVGVFTCAAPDILLVVGVHLQPVKRQTVSEQIVNYFYKGPKKSHNLKATYCVFPFVLRDILKKVGPHTTRTGIEVCVFGKKESSSPVYRCLTKQSFLGGHYLFLSHSPTHLLQHPAPHPPPTPCPPICS